MWLKDTAAANVETGEKTEESWLQMHPAAQHAQHAEPPVLVVETFPKYRSLRNIDLLAVGSNRDTSQNLSLNTSRKFRLAKKSLGREAFTVDLGDRQKT